MPVSTPVEEELSWVVQVAGPGIAEATAAPPAAPYVIVSAEFAASVKFETVIN
jgi:hypothetical protein